MDKTFSIALMCVSMSVVAISIALIFSSAFHSISRNPSAEEKISKYVFVGAGLAEALGLFSFIIAMLVLFA
ncbi:MAG: F0F1 ATP synthase subunit C [Alphaproteobacteria bacterium]|nr:F0F1 ATP synthase subunit C [Rickettsiales bacterium]